MNNLKDKIKQDTNWRQTYHLMPETGWLNDPNGACFYDGKYHIYHQYEPNTPNGGATHWGHKSSDNLVNFTEEEIFLSPDKPYDIDGVYSGGAFIEDGVLNFFYTGNVKNDGFYDYNYSGREQNVVRVISPDGYKVSERKVVIPHAAFPEHFSCHIRDPKVFKKDGTYHMILGARTREDCGALALFSSKDLDNWTYEGHLLEGGEDDGFMWECPDYFNQVGKDVLIFSPQGIIGSPYKHQNPYSAGYLIGEIDWDELKFEPEKDFEELDYGFDFYAPQSFTAPDDRVIMWAWMGVPDHSPAYVNPTVSYGWQHCLTMPRELKLQDGKLYQLPLVEYEILRSELEESTGSTYHKALDQVEFELQLTAENKFKDFELKLRQDTRLTYENGILILRHGASGYGRKKRQLILEELKEVRVFSDRSSLEIFINGGEYVMTTRIYPDNSKEQEVSLTSNSNFKVSYWNLNK